MATTITFLLIAFSFPQWVTSGKIVGGYVDFIQNVPYTVSLIKPNSGHFCGGTLISSEWVVTAAHCVYKVSPDDLDVRIGSSFRSKGGVIREVQQVIVSERYYPTLSMDYDVAVLKLKQRVSNIFDSINWVRMADSNSKYYAGMLCLVSGWGKTKDPNQSNNQIKSAMVEYIETNTCRRLLQPSVITERMICAGGQRDDACQGDSGGPLVCAGLLVGIVSWGKGCGNLKSPGVYTYVPEVRNWIYEKTGV
ncbi:trypsin-7-like [Armigeres subalbatus]|uniref:trypsin-7-like n=1 Tax=Armigeres subalbatus TaxID=124917 RepID=UPI002ED6AFB8